MITKRLTPFAAALLVFLCGCMAVNPDPESTETQGGQAQRVLLSGSTSMEELMNALAAGYSKEKAGVRVEVQSGGSSVGISNVKDGISDIGDSSRALKESEKKYGLTETVIALDGIAVVIHSENPVEKLSKTQLSGIFSGQITNWNQVGGADEPIVTIGREAGSGTRDGFEELLGIKDKAVYAIEAGETGLVKMKVSLEKNAVGYLSLGTAGGGVKVLSIDGVRPTEETVRDGSYTLQRGFLCLSRKNASQGAKDFLTYCLGEAGQEIVKKSGFVRIRS